MSGIVRSLQKINSKLLLKYIIFPPLLYAIIFIIFTYPAVWSFATRLFADSYDGLQNVWNLWWVNKAVTELHTSFWKTDFLHYPIGTTLIGHTLNPFNGMIAILLLKLFSIIQTYNLIFIFTFVMGGVSAYVLSYYISRSYAGSLAGGFIFSFSNFHFAQAEGHLQTISLEWLPLFILAWILFLKKPTIINALSSALLLYLNLICDYYYFFYCLMSGLILLIINMKVKKDIFYLLKNNNLISFLIFTVLTLLTSGSIILSLLITNTRDPFYGSHPSSMFSTDLLAVLIPGGHSRFANLTEVYWSRLPGNIHESSVSLGFTVLAVMGFVFVKKRKLKNKYINVWFFLFIAFFLFSLGPVLHIAGYEIPYIPMPYMLLEKIIPFIDLSGMPVRMMVMVNLSAAIIFSIGFEMIRNMKKKGRILIPLITFIMVMEFLPKLITTSKLEIPAYVKFLQSLPDGGYGILDSLEDKYKKLYYQTVHGKKIAFGYISRYPRSVLLSDYIILNLLNDNRFTDLCSIWGFKYFVVVNDGKIYKNIKSVYQDSDVVIYDMGVDMNCKYNQI